MPDDTGDPKSAATEDSSPPEPVAPAEEKIQPKPPPPPPIAKKAWGAPLMRFDQAWTRLEARVCAWVLVTEILALCLWISLKGLSAEYQTGSGERNVSGLVFRALLTAVLLGLGA